MCVCHLGRSLKELQLLFQNILSSIINTTFQMSKKENTKYTKEIIYQCTNKLHTFVERYINVYTNVCSNVQKSCMLMYKSLVSS